MNSRLLKILRCPLCGSNFKFFNDNLTCNKKHSFPVIEGIPNLIPELEKYKKTEESFSREWGWNKK